MKTTNLRLSISKCWFIPDPEVLGGPTKYFPHFWIKAKPSCWSECLDWGPRVAGRSTAAPSLPLGPGSPESPGCRASLALAGVLTRRVLRVRQWMARSAGSWAAAAAGARALGCGPRRPGESPHQPSPGRRPDGPIRAAQAVQHHERRPATGVGRGVDAHRQGGQDTLREFYPGGWTCRPRQMRTIRSTLLPARVTVAGLLLSC